MRILKIVLAISLLMPLSGFGQLHIGVRGGYNISIIEFLPIKRERSVFDPVLDAGLVVKYFDLKYFGFQGEINVTQRGYRAPLGEDIWYKRVNTYLEIPIFMQVRGSYKGFFTHFNAGFSAAYLIESIAGNNQTGEYVMTKYEPNILRDNRFDYGLIGGAAVGHDFKWGTLQLEVRYHHGLGDLYFHEFKGNPQRSPHRVQSISLAYLYNFSEILKRAKPLNQISIEN
jgi:hypothetical protein